MTRDSKGVELTRTLHRDARGRFARKAIGGNGIGMAPAESQSAAVTWHPPNNANLSGRLERFAAGLLVPEGPLAGEALTVLPWERDLFRLFDTPGDVAVSMARANGKTAAASTLACAAVDPAGPLWQRRGLCVIVAAGFKQAGIAFGDVLAFLFPDGVPGRNDRTWRVLDNQNVRRIEHRPTGSAVESIASDPRKAHGLRPSLVLLDEPAQWQNNLSEKMYAAMLTSAGKMAGCRIVAIGTRPSDPGHWFEKMLTGPRAICYKAAPDADPFAVASWRAANPSLDHLPELRPAVQRHAAQAKADPSMLASFRALKLNSGVSEILVSLIVTVDSWKRAEGDVPAKGPWILGVDLSGGVAVSACAAYWPKGGRLDAFGVFPKVPDLQERGRQDGVGTLYMEQAERGELLTMGRETVPYPDLLLEAVSRWGKPVAVVGDHYRVRELRDALHAARIGAPLVTRQHGWKDGAEDLRAFRRAVLERTVRPVKSLLLRSAVNEARGHIDNSGNERLALKTQSGRRALARDDAIAASLLAVAHGLRLKATLSGPRRDLIRVYR